jgi:hypothetical protein
MTRKAQDMIAAGQTLYARIPAWLARALLALILVLTILPALPHPALTIPGERKWGEPGLQKSDASLYKQIVADMEAGHGYYAAAANEHRAFHYPTSPPQVFRLPTLAWILARLHFHGLQLAALLGVDAAVIILFYRELLAGQMSFGARLASIAVLATGLSIVGLSDAVYWHEVWAALLIAISLLSYRDTRWWPSVLFALLACLIREIAAPYLFVMAGFALLEKRWDQFAAWLGAIALVAAVFLLHLHVAAGSYRPGDIISPSWLGLGGWDFAIATAKWNILLHVLPYPLIALALCLGIIGLAGGRDGRAWRAAVVVAGYLTGFLVVGRPDNYYWGILYAPLLPAGFLLAPAALGDLMRRAFSRAGAV